MREDEKPSALVGLVRASLACTRTHVELENLASVSKSIFSVECERKTGRRDFACMRENDVFVFTRANNAPLLKYTNSNGRPRKK